MDQIHPSTAAKELKAIGDREYSQQSAVGLVSYSYALFPSQGHPTDFRRVEFTMPQYDKEYVVQLSWHFAGQGPSLNC